MQKYIARRFQSFQSGLSLDTEALKRYPDVIDLSIGDTDFITDRRIIDAAFADARAGYTHYGDPKGDPALIDAYCAAWQEDFGQALSPAEVLVTTSSCMGMGQALLALLNPGDEVLVLAPYFAVYRQQIELAGGVCVEVPTRAEDGYRPRPEALDTAVTERTKALILNTPCNPTGAAYDRETLGMLARFTQEHDLLAIADEIYTRYLYDGEFIPLRTLPGMKDRTVTLNSFSKNFMMTGWRVGVILAHPELIRVFQHVNNGLTYTTPAISQRAALHALRLRREIAEEYISYYKERVFAMADRLEAMPGFSLVRPRGTFYLFPGIEKTGLEDGAFCDLLLREAHVLVSPGSAFGAAGKNHFRIAATVPMDRLMEAADRMEKLHICSDNV
ncbi:MAG: aminotransferase class I/II-fold pyridoxal phosphate-dependent enzyme [Clostridia bacterium]|nr:aminotransferase class I/II-fold pyridoxal phosphate-dependent enzyme [Clostridia bacterium]